MELKLRELEKQMGTISGIDDPTLYKSLTNEYSRLLVQYEGMDGYSIEIKIKVMLLGLGLREEALTIPVNRLSGGEKMRVAIARILLEEPDLLILDEPTNHLDIQATEWLEGFLKKFGGGILIVSHDRYFLDQVATRIAELENGTITERSGTYSAFMEQKRIMREFALKEQNRLKWQAGNTNKLVQELKGMGRIKASQSREHALKRMKEELSSNVGMMKQQKHLYRTVVPKISFGNVKHVSAEIARAEGLYKAFQNVVLFSDVSFLIRGGERIGIIGPNGCGKTTLLNMLLGSDTDFKGFARLGHWVRYAYVGQIINFVDENRTVIEELIAKKEMQEPSARDYLSRFQFYGDEVDKIIGVLSGGERVRLHLACIMLDEPDCLVLDEPTNHLDMPARDAVETALTEFKGTIIAVSHDRYFLNRCVERIFDISDGKIISYQGNYDFYRQTKTGRASGKEASGIVRNEGAKYRGTQQQEKCRSANVKVDEGTTAVSREKLEQDICRLEGRLKELEASFGEATPCETYREYEQIAGELNEMYIFWEDMTE